MLSELCVWLSLLDGILEKSVCSGYESGTKLALWMFSVALYEVKLASLIVYQRDRESLLSFSINLDFGNYSVLFMQL